MSDFRSVLNASYGFTVPTLDIGNAMFEDKAQADVPIRIPVGVMNRHGLIAGSTGTGKTRTLQLLAEGLSRAGVPVFVSDVKGDLAGLAKPGDASPKVLERCASVGREFKPEGFPVEFFSLTGTNGIQVRATVSSFGPVLLGKVLDLTEVQQSVLALVFKYCDDRQLPLLDFKDLRDALSYLTNEGKAELKDYGGMSAATVGVLLRKMVELEQQGAERFFGEPELDIHDLMRTDPSGRGMVNIINLSDVQDKPRLYSTFLMWLLGRFYYGMPEVGDPEKPKLVFFFDEAHLLFEDSSSALVEYVEQVSRLIRSKGIGVFFITQTPKDVEEDVLAQLGNRMQHGVRVFTPKDAKDLKATASTFPPSELYDIAETLKSLGTGEGLVTVLSPKGVPTEVARTQMIAPSSCMSSLADAEYAAARSRSTLAAKYATPIDRESAHEILQRKLQESSAQIEQERPPAPAPYAQSREPSPWQEPVPRPQRAGARQPRSVAEEVVVNVARQAARSLTSQVVRGLFGMLTRRR